MASLRNLTEIHLAVVLFGLAGLFGKWLILPAIVIVWGRVLFATLSLLLLLILKKRPLALQKKEDYVTLALLGLLLAVHWITFFHSIQLSTVAVGLLTFSTFPIFAVLLEPLFFKERILPADITLAVAAFGGVALVVPELDLANAVTRGALWGTVSGATFALLSILNRRTVQRYSSQQIAFYQDGVAMLLLTPLAWLLQPAISLSDWGMLFILGVLLTAVSHTLFISGLRTVKARTAGIIASLEPVYGIIAAALLLGEIPSYRVIAGGLIILSVAVYITIMAGRREVLEIKS